ncbi:MAG TPA: hypothetical protein VM687_15185 [Stenotrophomonas sp.]|nr:hypothetical protein [Stenotrophomonas sp.]
MMIKAKLGTALLLVATTSNANAGPDGVFLCDSQAPYDFLTSDLNNYRQFGIRRNGQSLSDTDTGALIAGQGVKATSAKGLMVVPSQIGEQGWIELRKQGRLLRKIPGWIQFWDTWTDGRREKVTFTVWDADPGSRFTAWETRYIFDGNGSLLFEKRYQVEIEEEDFGPHPVFTADGEAFYEQAGDPLSVARLYSATDFRPIGKVEAPKDQQLEQLVMASATKGFAISAGRAYRFEHGALQPLSLPLTSAARKIQMDTRSRRVLIESWGDFAVMDLAGTLLYHFASPQPAGVSMPQGINARLAIDGSVGFMRTGDEMMTVLTRHSGYTLSRMVPLGRDDWNRVACFTPNSAALLVDDQPLLIKF